MAVLYGLPGTPGADSIPFAAAIVLSVACFMTAIIRLGGYFIPRSQQPLELILSVISIVVSGLLLGFVSSRNDSHWCQITYICSLFVNIGVVGTYEMEVCWQLNTTIFPRLKQILLVIGVLDVSLKIGLCVWFGNSNDDLSSILVVLLCSCCLLYSFVSFSYFKLLSRSQKPHLHLLGSAILCFSIVVSIIILLCIGGAKKLPGGVISSAWIALAILSVSTLRIPCRRWWNRDQLFGCRGDSEVEFARYFLSFDQISSGGG